MKSRHLNPVTVYVLAEEAYTSSREEELTGVLNATLRRSGEVVDRLEVKCLTLPFGRCTSGDLLDFIRKHIGVGQVVVFDGMRHLYPHLPGVALSAFPFLAVERRLENGRASLIVAVYDEDGGRRWQRPAGVSVTTHPVLPV